MHIQIHDVIALVEKKSGYTLIGLPILDTRRLHKQIDKTQGFKHHLTQCHIEATLDLKNALGDYLDGFALEKIFAKNSQQTTCKAKRLG